MRSLTFPLAVSVFSCSCREHHEGRERRYDAEEVEVIDWSDAGSGHGELEFHYEFVSFFFNPITLKYPILFLTFLLCEAIITQRICVQHSSSIRMYIYMIIGLH